MISISLLVFFSIAVNAANELPIKVTSIRTSGTCPLVAPEKNLTANIQQYISIIRSVLNERYNLVPTCACGGVNGPWKRVAFLNMTDTSQVCPTTWRLISSPVRGCRRSNFNPSCESTTFQSSGFTYNHVCGRVLGYQKGTPDAFDTILNAAYTIDLPYVDGVSITHGSAGSRQHVWTFAASVYEDDPEFVRSYSCECTNINYNWPYQVPSYVGNNYFCDTGYAGPGFHSGRVYSNNPLWDGDGCGANNTCCKFNHPPWFCRSLPQRTDDDLEVRICNDQNEHDEDIIVSLIEIYVALN